MKIPREEIMKAKRILGLAGLTLLAACPKSNITDINNQKVFFAYDSAEISKDAKAGLLAQSEYLKSHANQNVLIAGNCDERGTVEYNFALGQRRANAAKAVLVKDGISAKRLQTISYGKERPAARGTGEKVWSQNRNATTLTETR